MQLTHCPLHSYFLFLPFKSTSACLTKCNVTFLFPSLHCMRRSLCIFTQAIREWRAGGFIFSAQTANWYGCKGYTWHEEVSRVWHGAKRRYICNRPINEIKVWIGFPVSASFRHALFEWVLSVNESIIANILSFITRYNLYFCLYILEFTINDVNVIIQWKLSYLLYKTIVQVI